MTSSNFPSHAPSTPSRPLYERLPSWKAITWSLSAIMALGFLVSGNYIECLTVLLIQQFAFPLHISE